MVVDMLIAGFDYLTENSANHNLQLSVKAGTENNCTPISIYSVKSPIKFYLPQKPLTYTVQSFNDSKANLLKMVITVVVHMVH